MIFFFFNIINNFDVQLSVRRIIVSEQQELSLKLKKFTIINDADKGSDGEILAWTRIAHNFVDDSFGTGTRHEGFTTLGPINIGDGKSHYLQTSVRTHDAPFIYGEIDVFDADSLISSSPDITGYLTKRLEEVGVTSVLFFPDDPQGTYTFDEAGVGQSSSEWQFG